MHVRRGELFAVDSHRMLPTADYVGVLRRVLSACLRLGIAPTADGGARLHARGEPVVKTYVLRGREFPDIRRLRARVRATAHGMLQPVNCRAAVRDWLWLGPLRFVLVSRYRPPYVTSYALAVTCVVTTVTCQTPVRELEFGRGVRTRVRHRELAVWHRTLVWHQWCTVP